MTECLKKKKFCDWLDLVQVISSLSHGIYFIRPEIIKTSLCIVHLLCLSAWNFKEYDGKCNQKLDRIEHCNRLIRQPCEERKKSLTLNCAIL